LRDPAHEEIRNDVGEDGALNTDGQRLVRFNTDRNAHTPIDEG